MATLGEELKRERELRGISLKEISDSTKISVRYLRAIENDQLDILPGKFFTKGIIRSFAKCLGLEEEAALNKYYEDMQRLEESQEDERKKREAESESLRVKKILPYAIIFIVLALIALSLFLFYPRKIDTFLITDIPKHNPEGDLVAFSPSALLDNPFPGDRIFLEITFLQRSWIQIYADGKLKAGGVKRSGETIRIMASDELLLHLGNAGGVIYSLNGRKGKPLGASGAVMRDIKITSENLNEFFSQEKEGTESTKT